MLDINQLIDIFRCLFFIFRVIFMRSYNHRIFLSYISRRLIEDNTRKNCYAEHNIVIIALRLIFIGKYLNGFASIFRIYNICLNSSWYNSYSRATTPTYTYKIEIEFLFYNFSLTYVIMILEDSYARVSSSSPFNTVRGHRISDLCASSSFASLSFTPRKIECYRSSSLDISKRSIVRHLSALYAAMYFYNNRLDVE